MRGLAHGSAWTGYGFLSGSFWVLLFVVVSFFIKKHEINMIVCLLGYYLPLLLLYLRIYKNHLKKGFLKYNIYLKDE